MLVCFYWLFFSLWIKFSSLFICLEIFYWMSNIVIFILLDDGTFFFGIPKHILKLCSEILRFRWITEISLTLWGLSLSFVGGTSTVSSLGLILSTTEAICFWALYLMSHELWEFFSLDGAKRNCAQLFISFRIVPVLFSYDYFSSLRKFSHTHMYLA